VAAGLRSLHRDRRRCRLPLTGDLEKVARELFDALESYSQNTSKSSYDVSMSSVESEAPTSTARGSGPRAKSSHSKPPAKPEVPTPLIRKLQEYFFLSVTTVIKSAKDEKFTCPVQVYLACYGYNDDDTFKAPSEITPQLANWQYLLRCTALFQANRLVELEQADSVLT